MYYSISMLVYAVDSLFKLRSDKVGNATYSAVYYTGQAKLSSRPAFSIELGNFIIKAESISIQVLSLALAAMPT